MNKFFLLSIVLFASCTAVKVAVPDALAKSSTRLQVKGLQGWQINQRLTFGNFSTSQVKRGWDFTASVAFSKMRLSPEEMILQVFDIRTDKNTNYQRNRFQYSVQDGTDIMEVFATEKFREQQLVYKSNNPFIGNASQTNRYEYAFTAAILPLKANTAPWSLVLINKYDIARDTARKLFDRPYVEEEGYVTNGKENISIRPLRLDQVTTRSGKDRKIFGGKMLTGYELSWDNGVVGIIDIMDNAVWIYNELEREEKLLLAAISSAIMLKRMQDVEKDKEHFDR